MDELDEREAFLKAIFATPEDDLPRLAYADWLEERGEVRQAEFIRMQCAEPRIITQVFEPVVRLYPLIDEENEFERRSECISVHYTRGFRNVESIRIYSENFSSADSFRKWAIGCYPEIYGAKSIKIGGTISEFAQLQTLMISPCTQSIVSFDFSGFRIEQNRNEESELEGLPDQGYFDRAAITTSCVQHLASMREARRIEVLDLRNNELDNDAARAIVASKHLIRLKSLLIFEGNRLRGRTWQQLLDRYGEDVVQ